MPTRKITQVRKRDDRIVPYDEANVAEAIHRAALAAGQDNRYLADDLAAAVSLYIERHYDREIPTSEEIHQMVEKVLFETGHPAIAKAFILYRENKGRVAEPAAAPVADDLFPADQVLVDGLTRDEVSAWGRDRIITALVKEAGLEESAASDVAAVVERRIFRLGRRRISTVLIRELVNQELLERGYGSKVPRQIVVGLPKYDLARLFEPGPPDPDALVRTIGETTLKQYALQEVFPTDVADAHLEGRIHIHDLEQPLKAAWMGLSIDDLKPVPGLPPDSARTLTARIQAARGAVERRAVRVELLNLNAHYAPLSSSGAEEAVHLLLALDGWVPGLDLSRQDSFSTDFLRAARENGRRGERVIVAGEAHTEALREACRQAVEGAPTLFILRRDDAWYRSRFGRRPALAQCVTLNLPQLFFRNESDFYGELEKSFDLAVRAHLERRRFLQRFHDLPEGAGYAVALAGLDDLLRLMGSNSAAQDEGALKLALRVVSYLYFRLREESARHGIDLTLEDPPTEAAAERFLRVDNQIYPRARSLEAQGYSPSFHLREGDPQTRLRVESRFHTLIPSGRVCISAAGLAPSDLESLLTSARRQTLASQLHLTGA